MTKKILIMLAFICCLYGDLAYAHDAMVIDPVSPSVAPVALNVICNLDQNPNDYVAVYTGGMPTEGQGCNYGANFTLTEIGDYVIVESMDNNFQTLPEMRLDEHYVQEESYTVTGEPAGGTLLPIPPDLITASLANTSQLLIDLKIVVVFLFGGVFLFILVPKFFQWLKIIK